jgi:RNA polymerase sigma factor (sigma-70 family)
VAGWHGPNATLIVVRVTCCKDRANWGVMIDLDDLDDELLLGACERSDEAFAIFYRRHVETVLRVCARRGLDAAGAADVTAETFAAALLARGRYRPRLGAPRAWLLGIAANKLADHGRRFAREERAQRRLGLERCELSERDVADFDALRGELEETTEAALADLSASQRSAVYARVVEGQQYADIGRRFRISEATARQRVSRGLAKLRARISKEPS